MRLARSRDGKVIHTRKCLYANPDRPWHWADEKSHDEIRYVMSTFGYRACRKCLPFWNTVIINES